jgi:serine/threonine protein kinase
MSQNKLKNKLSYRNHIDTNKNLTNFAICEKLIEENKMEFLDKGRQAEIFKAYSSTCGTVVIKRRLFKKEDNDKYERNVDYIKNRIRYEQSVMLQTNKLINNFICPNFIYLYNKNIKNDLIIMEYADGTSTFLYKDYCETNIYKTFLFQALCSIYVFNNYLKIYHNDVKLSNILYKKIDPKIIFKYNINGINYWVPSYGYLFMLADFGIAGYKKIYCKDETEKLELSILFALVYYAKTKYKNEIAKIPELEEKINLMTNKDIPYKENNYYNDRLKINNQISNMDSTLDKFAFEILPVLNYSRKPLEIIKKYFGDFTEKKQNFSNGNIIEFNIK